MLAIKRKISFSECNEEGNLSIYKITNICQDFVSEYTESFEMDNFTLREKYQKMWVFIKNKIELFKEIRWNKEVTIECKLVKASKIKAYFRTTIKENENLLASSLLECCLIDVNDFKIAKLVDFNMPIEEENVAFEYAGAIKDGYEFVKNFEVSPIMLDYSHHMNNAEYARVIQSEMIKNVSYFEIQYACQARLNDKLTIYKATLEDKTSYQILNEANEIVVKTLLK